MASPAKLGIERQFLSGGDIGRLMRTRVWRDPNAKHYLKNLFKQAPVAICLLKGPSFIIDAVNPLMLKYWHKTSGEVIDKRIADVFPEMIDQGFVRTLNTVFQNGKRFVAKEVPMRILRRGKLYHSWVSFVCEPLKEIDGKVSSIIAIGHDVTDLVLARKAAQQMTMDLERLVDQRTADLQQMNDELVLKNLELEQFSFLSNHDLQEPLRKIRMFAGLLQHNINNQGAVENYVQKIDSSVSRMSDLIQSLLMYSNVSHENDDYGPVDLNVVLKFVSEDLELQQSKKDVVIRSGDLPCIPGNGRQITELFCNLINNAIKFCVHQPTIEITCQPVTASEKAELKLYKKQYIHLTFKDNGIGFDQQYADKSFQIFQRLHAESKYPGTGIGLALCRKIAEKHHGTITVKSKVGEGSTFHVYLAN